VSIFGKINVADILTDQLYELSLLLKNVFELHNIVGNYEWMAQNRPSPLPRRIRCNVTLAVCGTGSG
jgi:hypothetical protein